MMKKLWLMLICASTIAALFAQDDEFKTIFKRDDNKHLRITGFGGPMMILCI